MVKKIQILFSQIIYKYKVICRNKFIVIILNGDRTRKRTIKFAGKTIIYE
jgi:hypothetical protein